MGSQQLLLIVLGVIIVGIAIAVGISTFGSSADQENRDAITKDMLQMAAQAQSFFNKPRLLGGGEGSFSGITIKNLGLDDEGSGRATNDNAQYFIIPIGGSYLYIVGRSTSVKSSYVVARIMVSDIRFFIIGWGSADTDPT